MPTYRKEAFAANILPRFYFQNSHNASKSEAVTYTQDQRLFSGIQKTIQLVFIIFCISMQVLQFLFNLVMNRGVNCFCRITAVRFALRRVTTVMIIVKEVNANAITAKMTALRKTSVRSPPLIASLKSPTEYVIGIYG